jgi:thiosulfate dehydrogenase
MIARYTRLFTIIMITCVLIAYACNNGKVNQTGTKSASKPTPGSLWKAPDSTAIPKDKTGDMIRYGKELLAHTAKYFGPNGSIAQLSNGMNCQNCHLEGGSRLFANNYASVAATYPKLSFRSGKIQPISQRITDCFNRSLAGKVPDTNGREVRAMIAYINWIGQGVKKGKKLFGAASGKMAYLAHPADPVKGQAIFISKCKVCHGANGEGILAADKKTYTYPPLWGVNSYNNGAGMYRISNLAGFVKNNMPFGATYKTPLLTNEEAWNVAAFINSQPRPHYDQRNDWKDLKNKPIDFPFGPYADNFSEAQHKYGPYGPMKAVSSK